MTSHLDQMLSSLKDAPVDHRLDGLTEDVRLAIAQRRAAGAQAWGIRAMAFALITTSGIAISASSVAAAGQHAASPILVWSDVAPALLLDAAK